ncbi:MAG: ABC transporter transmembrane domain-containing protein [Prochlorococcaceae cyanobacterium]
MVVYLVVMALIGGWLVLVPLVLLPVFFPLARRVQRRQLAELKRLDEQRNFRDAVLLSSLQGAETMKGLGIEAFMVRRLEPIQESLCAAELQLQHITGRLSHLGQVYGQWCTLLVVTFGAWLVMEESLSIGALAACTLLGRQITHPFARFLSMASQDEVFAHAQSRLDTLLSLPAEPALLEGDGPPPGGVLQVGPVSVAPAEALLVQASDPREATRWLESLTLLGEPNPLPVLYAGRAVASWQRSLLRQRLPLLRENDALFRGTVLDNLTGFRPQLLGQRATELCDRHGVSAEILALPRGYDTLVGDQAEFPLSPLLAFRLQVMAALVADPAVLLLDRSARRPLPELLAWLPSLLRDVGVVMLLPEWPTGPLAEGVRLARLQNDRLEEQPR